MNNPTDLLKLSIAKGIGKDERVVRPKQIDLNKGKKLNKSSDTQQGITALIDKKGPEINFEGKTLQKPVSSPAISLKSTLLYYEGYFGKK